MTSEIDSTTVGGDSKHMKAILNGGFLGEDFTLVTH
jgi:hypothetical protein